MRKTEIITISSEDAGKFFFTTDHCQNHGLGGDWVPVTTYLPMKVVPRESLPDGIIKNKEDYKRVFCNDLEEIKNPQEEFQG